MNRLVQLLRSPSTYPLSVFWFIAMLVVPATVADFLPLTAGLVILTVAALVLILISSYQINLALQLSKAAQAKNSPILLEQRYVTVGAIRWSMATLFVISMLTSSYVLHLSSTDDDAIRANILQIQKNTLGICKANNLTAKNTNAILDTLISATQSSGNTQQFKSAVTKQYQEIKVPVFPCK